MNFDVCQRMQKGQRLTEKVKIHIFLKSVFVLEIKGNLRH